MPVKFNHRSSTSTSSAARIGLVLFLTALLVFPDGVAIAQTMCNSASTSTSWTAFPSTAMLPTPIETLNAVVNNGYLYVVGGSTGTTGFQNTVSFVQLSTTTGLPVTGTGFTATTHLPVALSRDLCGVAYNGYLYTVGGVQAVGTNGTTTTNVQYAKIVSSGVNKGSIGAWTTNTNPLMEAVQLHGSVVLNGYLYVIGGSLYKDVSNAPSKITPHVWYAKISTDGSGSIGPFTATTSLPIPLYKTCPVAIGNVIYMLGGETDGNDEIVMGDPAVNTVYYATPNTTGTQIGAIPSWTKAPYTIPVNYFNTMNPSGLASQAVVYVNTKGIVFMGGDTTGNGGDTNAVLEASNVTGTSINWNNLPPPNLPDNFSRNAGATLNHYAYSVAGLLSGNGSSGDTKNVYCLLFP